MATIGSRLLCLVVTVLALVGFAGSPAMAEIAEDDLQAEFWVGYNEPSPDLLAANTTFGARFGRSVTDMLGFYFEVEYFKTDIDLLLGSADYKSWLFDVAFDFHINPDDRAVFVPFAGIGFALVDTTSGQGPVKDSWTLQAGLAGKIELSHLIYLRPAVRTRWFEARDNDPFDVEALLALGFRWD